MARIIKYYVENGLTVIEDGNDSEFIRPSFNYNSVNDTVTIINLDNQAQDWSGPSSEFRDKNGNSIGTTKAEILAYLSDNTVFSKGESGSSTNPTSGIVPVNENGVFVDSVIAESNGKIGIGTTNPGEILTLSGTGQVRQKIISTDNQGARLDLHSSGGSRYSLQSLANGDFMLFDELSSHFAQRYFNGASGAWAFYTAGTEKMRINSLGKVGIGTTSPSTELHVVGAITVNDGNNNTKVGTNSGLNFTGINQSAFGYNAGLSSSGDNQTVVGYQAGQSNTATSQSAFGRDSGRLNTGINQSAFGRESGSNNSGENQSVLGSLAGFSNTGDNQTAVGRESGRDNTGDEQSAFGSSAGKNNTGTNQSAFGSEAGKNNTRANQSAFGIQAGQSNSGNNQSAFGFASGRFNTGNDQSAFGFFAGSYNTGANQSAVGYAAGSYNTGDNQSAFGFWAGRNNTGGSQSAFGRSAGLNNTGSSQSAFGYEAGVSNTGTNQSAFGFFAGRNNTGFSQSAFGYAAGRNNTGGSQSAFGYFAGFSNTGVNQSAFGRDAGKNNTGDNNSNFGYRSGYYLSDGTTVNTSSSNSVFLGSNTKALGASQANQIVIGHDATGIGANSVTLGNDNIATTALKGNVGIGTTSPSTALHVVGAIALNDGNNSTKVGTQAGEGYTGNNQSAFGFAAGRLNTGADQSAVGYYSGENNSGIFQSAFGSGAGRNNTGGNQSAFGVLAGRDNTGVNQSAFGRNAGKSNTGDNNSNFGYEAGYRLSDGTTVNTASSNSVFLGSNTKALGASQTNQIVIGHDATGIGANSVTLGNDSIATTALKGNVGIGTTAPSDKLHIKSGTGDSIVRIESLGVNGSKSGVRFQNSTDINNNAGGIYSERIGGIEHDIIIETWGNPSGTERLRIKNNGNVGIGTTTPTEKLDVGGIVKAEGYKSSDGSAGITQNVNTGGGNTLVIKNGIITQVI